jgi:hypothetical protein
VAVVVEDVAQPRVAHDAAGRGDVGLLHRQHDVVLQRLRAALDQQVVGRQARAADAEPGAADDVLDRVGHAVAPLDLGDRVEVRLVGGADLGLLVILEAADARRVGEPALVAVDHGHRLEQVHARAHAGGEEDPLQGALGGLQREPDVLVALAGGQRAHALQVAGRVARHHRADRRVGQRLAEAEERKAGRHALQVPREVPEVGLVEVVDVEDEDPGVVHVRAVVLGVEVALDPHPAGALVGPRVVELRHVGVEQARAATVEGERVGGHAAELAPEGARVRLDQVLEGVDEHGDDALAARGLLAGDVRESALGVGHGRGIPAARVRAAYRASRWCCGGRRRGCR